MLCTDLTLPVMILLSVMALTVGFPAEKTHENRLYVLVEIRDSQPPEERPSCPLCRAWNTRHKNKTRKYLEPIVIKLENVNGKYEEKQKELAKFYPRFNQLTLPKGQQPSKFGCLNFKKLNKKVWEFTREVRKIKKSLQWLISLEKSPKLKKHDRHEGRLKLLKEFLAEIKNLLVELKPNRRMKKKKRRNKSLTNQMPEKSASANLSHIKSQTKLMIEEWKLLRNLETVLENWTKNFKNFLRCM